MNLIDIFKKNKNSTNNNSEKTDPYLLGKMWLCLVDFCPGEVFRKAFVNVPINMVVSTADGLQVRTYDISHPFDRTSGKINGFFGVMKQIYSNTWSGFFETEEEAKRAFNELMDEWIDIMQNGKVSVEGGAK